MIKKTIKLLIIAGLSTLWIACNNESRDIQTEEQIINEFTKEFYKFYDTYGEGDISFVDYYAENVVTMDNTGEIMTGSEKYREIWSENFKVIKIDKLDYTKPEIIYSRDMILTYNNYDERFIHLETGDTTEVRGTWIAVWKKREGNWKVVMNTFHLEGE